MKKTTRKLLVLCLLAILVAALAVTAFAAEEGVEEAEASSVSAKALAAGIGIGIAATGGAIAMGFATSHAVDGIARQPEADGKIRTSLMLGLVFIETAIIYALLAGILIIFVL